MSTNQTTAREVMYRTNRRKFLGYLSAAPTLTAFAGAGLLLTQSAFADKNVELTGHLPTQYHWRNLANSLQE